MHLRHHEWEHVVKAKAKRSTAISVLRWTLLRHEEMHWLNQYWAQPIPKSSIVSKYWQRLFIVKSLNTRHEIYEYLHDEEARRERHRLRMEKKKRIFGTLDMKYNPQRWPNLYALAQAARLGYIFVIDGVFEYAHACHSYFSLL
ncbi:unnamed protein product [Rotaria socialis]